jgi:16S rRNA (adenine1518-N6/adenine1519-N6)-dimethyltransferase
VNYDSPRDIERALRQLGIGLKKRWGQNFLINRGLREKIVDILAPQAGELLWEIGPGLGALTDLLARLPSSLILFEIDWKIIGYLTDLFETSPAVEIVPGDVLKTWKKTQDRRGTPDRIVGNLPYNSATAIVASFCEANLLPKRAVFTVQKELAQRMIDPPGSKNYSAFSILCRSTYDIRRHGDISAGSFYPAPQVVSSIVELQPRTREPLPNDRRLFSALVRACFSSRRKTLRNNIFSSPYLKGFDIEGIEQAALQAGFDISRRGEVYSPDDFIRLSNRLSEKAKSDSYP